MKTLAQLKRQSLEWHKKWWGRNPHESETGLTVTIVDGDVGVRLGDAVQLVYGNDRYGELENHVHEFGKDVWVYYLPESGILMLINGPGGSMKVTPRGIVN